LPALKGERFFIRIARSEKGIKVAFGLPALKKGSKLHSGCLLSPFEKGGRSD